MQQSFTLVLTLDLAPGAEPHSKEPYLLVWLERLFHVIDLPVCVLRQ